MELEQVIAGIVGGFVGFLLAQGIIRTFFDNKFL